MGFRESAYDVVRTGDRVQVKLVHAPGTRFQVVEKRVGTVTRRGYVTGGEFHDAHLGIEELGSPRAVQVDVTTSFRGQPLAGTLTAVEGRDGITII